MKAYVVVCQFDNGESYSDRTTFDANAGVFSSSNGAMAFIDVLKKELEELKTTAIADGGYLKSVDTLKDEFYMPDCILYNIHDLIGTRTGTLDFAVESFDMD